MELVKIIEAIAQSQYIIIKHYKNNNIFYKGRREDFKVESLENWLVHEIILSDKNNYNSTYIITVF